MRLADLVANRKLDGRTTFQGLQISIENAKGSTRKGIGGDGKPWKVTMSWPYGYIRQTEGVDGDHVDCFLGPNPNATHAYVIHTNNEKGGYDEDKVFLGFDSADDAKEAFLDNYSSPKFFRSMDAMPMAKFKEKVLATKDHPVKLAAMSRMDVAVIMAGGPGSGCHGDNCGRHKGAVITHKAPEDVGYTGRLSVKLKGKEIGYLNYENNNDHLFSLPHMEASGWRKTSRHSFRL